MSARQRWAGRSTGALVAAASFLVFATLDLLDAVLCVVYRIADSVLDARPRPCYCQGRPLGVKDGGEEEAAVSETLYMRRNVFRDTGLLGTEGGSGGGERGRGKGDAKSRWSDCGCESCAAWMGKEHQRLHFVVREPNHGGSARGSNSTEDVNVIFLHGFLSSSSFWVESVFQNLSERAKQNCRLIAVDLLGFGESPKPADGLYRLKDHVQVIEDSILEHLHLDSFHLVAHSMGCVIALALAAKHPGRVKSVTLVAPPYFPSDEEEAGHAALNHLAARRIWPPMLLAAAFMSWYEHLGRTVCLVVCRNHRKWEWILKLLTGRRKLPFFVTDITKHTHRSAWHTMHNVLCGGAKFVDRYLETLNSSGAVLKISHGAKDQVVPLECSFNLKSKAPHSKLQILPCADHNTIVFGRERYFTSDLEETWFSSAN